MADVLDATWPSDDQAVSKAVLREYWALINEALASSGLASDLEDLGDVPAYAGNAQKYLRVTADEIAVEWVDLVTAAISDFNESVDDRVNALLVEGANITLTYDDIANTLTIAGAAGGGGALELSELTDVSVSTPTNRNVLVADGAAFVSRALLEADISDLASYAAAVHTHAAADITDFNEALDDRVNALLVQGANITLTYDDIANTLTIAGAAGGGAVDSVFGRTGAVVAALNDYAASLVNNDSGVVGATVADALNTLNGAAGAPEFDHVVNGTDYTVTSFKVGTDGAVKNEFTYLTAAGVQLIEFNADPSEDAYGSIQVANGGSVSSSGTMQVNGGTGPIAIPAGGIISWWRRDATNIVLRGDTDEAQTFGGNVTVTGDLTVNGAAVTLPAGVIATADLADLAVSTAKLADTAVDTAKITDGAVTTAKLADLAVSNAKIANTAVDTAKLADGAVSDAKLVDMAEATVKGRAVGAGTGDPVNLTPAQLNAIVGAAALTLGLDLNMGTGGRFDGGSTVIQNYRQKKHGSDPLLTGPQTLSSANFPEGATIIHTDGAATYTVPSRLLAGDTGKTDALVIHNRGSGAVTLSFSGVTPKGSTSIGIDQSATLEWEHDGTTEYCWARSTG